MTPNNFDWGPPPPSEVAAAAEADRRCAVLFLAEGRTPGEVVRESTEPAEYVRATLAELVRVGMLGLVAGRFVKLRDRDRGAKGGHKITRGGIGDERRRPHRSQA